MKGCVNSYIDGNGEVRCRMCSLQDNLILSGNACLCKNGYSKLGDSEKCTETCGDSLIILAECDDGNTKSGDGCSSVCNLE
jgi:cysteine-rich repeat protein